MRHLILLRHAKSDWFSGVSTDFERPVSKRGQRDLPLIAAALRPYLTGKVLCLISSALRTRQTFDLGASYWPKMTSIYEDSLYEASAPKISNVIEKAAADTETIMVIAHNPGLSMLLHHLQPDSPLHMPTSCACVLNSENGQVHPNMPLIAFLTPKLLKEGGDKNASTE